MSSEFIHAQSYEHDDTNLQGTSGNISSALIAPLQDSLVWARVLAVIGFIVTGLLFLALAAVALFGVAGNAPVALIAVLVGVPVVLLIYGIPSWLIYRFSGAVSLLIRQRGISQFEAAIEAQRKFWRYLGGIGLVIVVLMAIGFGLMFLGLLFRLA